MPNRIKLSHPEEGGLVVGMSRNGKELYVTTEDTHARDPRGIVLPSICFMALAGESMVCVDPKAELYPSIPTPFWNGWAMRSSPLISAIP